MNKFQRLGLSAIATATILSPQEVPVISQFLQYQQRAYAEVLSPIVYRSNPLFSEDVDERNIEAVTNLRIDIFRSVEKMDQEVRSFGKEISPTPTLAAAHQNFVETHDAFLQIIDEYLLYIVFRESFRTSLEALRSTQETIDRFTDGLHSYRRQHLSMGASERMAYFVTHCASLLQPIFDIHAVEVKLKQNFALSVSQKYENHENAKSIPTDMYHYYTFLPYLLLELSWEEVPADFAPSFGLKNLNLARVTFSNGITAVGTFFTEDPDSITLHQKSSFFHEIKHVFDHRHFNPDAMIQWTELHPGAWTPTSRTLSRDNWHVYRFDKSSKYIYTDSRGAPIYFGDFFKSASGELTVEKNCTGHLKNYSSCYIHSHVNVSEDSAMTFTAMMGNTFLAKQEFASDPVMQKKIAWTKTIVEKVNPKVDGAYWDKKYTRDRLKYIAQKSPIHSISTKDLQNILELFGKAEELKAELFGNGGYYPGISLHQDILPVGRERFASPTEQEVFAASKNYRSLPNYDQYIEILTKRAEAVQGKIMGDKVRWISKLKRLFQK